LVVISLITLVTLLGEVDTARSEIRQLENAQQKNYLEILALQSRVEECNNPIKEDSLNLEKVDYETNSAIFDYTLQLKEYSDTTKVVLDFDGRQVELVQEAVGKFVGKVQLELFMIYENAKLLITESGKTMVRDAGFGGDIFRGALPMPIYHYNIDSSVKGGHLTVKGTYFVEMENRNDVKSITAVYLTGGEEFSREDITNQVLNGEEIGFPTNRKLERDLVLRLEITTISGYRITEQKQVCYPEEAEVSEYEEICDAKGTVRWKVEYH